MMNVTTGQHPGRPFTRGNRCRSTAERSTVQFGESVRLGGGAWPVVGPPDVRRGRATGPDAERASYLCRRHAEGATERSGVVLALETKFLRFETRQEQHSVLSRSPASACNVCPRSEEHTSE